MSDFGWIFLSVLALAATIITFFVVRRRRYIGSLRDQGWAFASTPTIASALMLGNPPFDVGLKRSMDELITGRTKSGVAFQVFEYEYSGAGPEFAERVAVVQLPMALPECYLWRSDADPRRQSVILPRWPAPEGWVVTAENQHYAQLILGALPAIEAFRQGGPANLSIDGANLVAYFAPKDADELSAYLDRLAGVVGSLNFPALQGFAVQPKPPRFGFYRHPDWVLHDADPSLIDKYDLDSVGGFNHATSQVIHGTNNGLPLTAFQHTWQTTHVQTYTDSEGRLQTRTVTDNHTEQRIALQLPCVFPYLSVNFRGYGDLVEFEGEEFNDWFDIRAAIPKFAYDVIHPRMMDYLSAARPGPFAISGNTMMFYPGVHDLAIIEGASDFGHGFCALIPAFVWKDLGIAPPQWSTPVLAPPAQ